MINTVNFGSGVPVCRIDLSIGNTLLNVPVDKYDCIGVFIVCTY